MARGVLNAFYHVSLTPTATMHNTSSMWEAIAKPELYCPLNAQHPRAKVRKNWYTEKLRAF